MVERLWGSVVVLQQHPFRFPSLAGVKYRLQLQELQRRTNTHSPQAQGSQTERKTQQTKKTKKQPKIIKLAKSQKGHSMQTLSGAVCILLNFSENTEQQSDLKMSNIPTSNISVSYTFFFVCLFFLPVRLRSEPSRGRGSR